MELVPLACEDDVDAVTLDSYATVVVLVKERKRKIVKLEEPGIVKR